MTTARDLGNLGAALAAALPGRVFLDAALGARTTWRVGGTTAVAVVAATVDDLECVRDCSPPEVEFLVLGRGSNLLVADSGFAGVTVILGAPFEAVFIESGVVSAGGAAPLPVLARKCAAAGHAGLGFFVGIPGSVGGAVRMNAGGHGRDTFAVILDAGVFDLKGSGDVVRFDRERLDLGYRCSALSRNDVVVDARFRIEPGDAGRLRDELGDIVRWRSDHQPGGANAGSVFRNPVGDAAARLIDQECGLRGLRVGGAIVSEKHANFIQADPGSTAADVRELIATVRERVEQRTGIRLETEVREIGFESR